MAIIAILVTSFLEQRKLLGNLRRFFYARLLNYVIFFTDRNFNTPKELRYVYLITCLPVIIGLFTLKMMLTNHLLIYNLMNLFLFLLSVEILTWKEEAKNGNLANKRSFITTYATRFFAALFWFLVLPSAIGSICYLIIMAISIELKNKALDSMIYNVVVDKMLFYANVIPYTILSFFIAIAGNFEEVTHFLVEEGKSFNKSFYYLENVFNEVVLIAIGKDKFQIHSNALLNNETELLDAEKFTPQITAYIVALLYRAGIFFIGVLAIILLAAFIS